MGLKAFRNNPSKETEIVRVSSSGHGTVPCRASRRIALRKNYMSGRGKCYRFTKLDQRVGVRTPSRRTGYTLVELLLVVALSALAMSFLYRIFLAQHKVVIGQDRTLKLEQALHVTLERIIQEVRMAGYDPNSTGQFGFRNLPGVGAPEYGRATSDRAICFYSDTDGDGILDSSDAEQLAFRVNVAQNGSNLDGTHGKKPDLMLRKYSCGAVKWQPFSENVEALDLVYFDGNGAVISNASLSSRLDDIRAVQVTIVARTDKQEKGYRNHKIFRNPQGRIIVSAPGDGYRRRAMTGMVTCRNLGMDDQS